MGSGVDPSMTLHALLGPKDNSFLSRFLKQQIIHPALLRGGRDALTLSRSSSLSMACLCLAQQQRFLSLLRCGSRGERREPPLATSRLGAATGGRVEANVKCRQAKAGHVESVTRGARSSAVRSSFRTSGS